MKEFVEYFDKVVDCFEIGQVVVIEVNTDTEIEASIATIHYLEVTELYDICVWGGGGYRGTIKKKLDVHRTSTYSDKVCVLCIPDGDNGVNLFNQLLLLIVLKVHVPLGEARLTGAILNQDKANLHNTEEIGCVIKGRSLVPRQIIIYMYNTSKKLAVVTIDTY